MGTGSVSVVRTSFGRIQGFFVACLLLLGACGGVGGALLFLRWKIDRANSAAPALLNQSAQMFSEELLGSKRTLEILRDTLEKTPQLSEQERRSLLESTSTRIPHLAANGWVDRQRRFNGWVSAGALSSAELDRLVQESLRRSRWKRFLGQPATLTTEGNEGRLLLLFVQPLQMALAGQNLVSAVDVPGMLARRMPPGAQRRFSLQVTQGGRLLYRSPDWILEQRGKPAPATLQRTVSLDGIQWLLETQSKSAPWIPPWSQWILWAAILSSGLAISGMLWATGRLRHLATTDELTSLYNRRFFLERWKEEVARAKRYKRSLACLIIDINGFKRINDRGGHLIGDRVLRQVAGGLHRQLRKTDVLARFGGDEFIVALPETTLDQAVAVAEKLRGLDFDGKAVSAHARIGPVSLSVGAAQLQENDSPLDVIGRADRDLYASRRSAQTSKILKLTPTGSAPL